jgi:hypothetical protein
MPSRDDAHPPRLIELSDRELDRYLDHINQEAFRLADQLRRDAAALAGARNQPLGKLLPRITKTRARWKACQARQSAAALEAASRRMFKGLS